MSNVITVPGRSINTITAEIIVLTQQAQASALASACQIGKRLMEAKELVPHGEWGDYLKHEVSYSHSTANNFMRLFRELGENPNSQALGNLNPTQALRLLALPEEERESFAEEHDVAAMTTRELEQAIREKKAAQEMLAVATEENGDLQQRLADHVQQNHELRQQLSDLNKKKAEISAKDAERLRKEGAEAAASAAREQITAAQAKQKDAEGRNAQLQSRIDDLKAELQKRDEAKSKEPASAANPNYGAFKASFEGLIPAFQQMCKYAVAAADSQEQVTGHRNAIKGLLMKLGLLADREVVWKGEEGIT